MTGAPEQSGGIAVYKRLLGYAKAHWGVFLLAIVAMIVYSTTETFFAMLMKDMTDEAFVARKSDAIKMIPLLIVGLFLLRGIAHIVSTYAMAWIGRKVINRMRSEMFHKLLTLPSSFFDNSTSGQQISKLTFNVEQVAHATTNAITIIIRDTLTIIFLLAWMFYLSGYLSLSFLVIGPVIAVIIVVISRRFRAISRNIQASMGDITHVTQETIEGQRVVRTFGGEEYEAERFEQVNNFNRHQHMKLILSSSLSVSLIQFLAAIALAVIVYMATLQSSSSITSAGTFVSFITALLLLMPSIKRLTTVNATLQNGIAAGESIFALLDSASEPETGDRCVERVGGQIQFRDVSFSYKAGEPVLKHITLDIEPGETVAFVGQSGSGKSTLVNLLPRFYEITDGQILLDGVDIREYQRKNLRSQMALVTQQVTLFNDTIGRNIAYGSLQESSEEQIRDAAIAAHAMNYIEELPDGLDTLVGEHGMKLSGGQRQRIAIARALLKNAPLLILDEATSALDTESEKHVQAGLEQLMKNRTTLVIAHRLSTIENADRIVVLQDGEIAEIGTHKDLLSKNGLYANLYNMQFSDQNQA